MRQLSNPHPEIEKLSFGAAFLSPYVKGAEENVSSSPLKRVLKPKPDI